MTYEDHTVRIFDANMEELVFLSGNDEQYPWRPHCVLVLNSGLVLFSDLLNLQLLLFRLVDKAPQPQPSDHRKQQHSMQLQYVNMLAENLQVRPSARQNTLINNHSIGLLSFNDVIHKGYNQCVVARATPHAGEAVGVPRGSPATVRL